ncbi:catechol 1,2-dioxygenase 1 [Streptomyces himastatinicus ATCC 53653]|uniref:Catechol 1,2-dioxygenase 1 n=1 Tax=Streptomyces himastatinicus ATCC 53653 TaxID=457427 RepID=D9WH80_9ACTN|nr:catechol 1,2-dioxygenase 1 [Streptomyces himastatinicus]EFL29006.1 catechol 1,2-dioxygenase 1 [Streptomyces himastatinicus ATCC 53653]
MRPDEPGTPLIVSGHVLDGHGQPLAGAKLDIYHAADNGNYSGLYDDGVPKRNLRGHLFTGPDDRYTFTTITPVAYADPNVTAVDGVIEAVAALGRSLCRPAHIHYEVHNADLITPWRGEIYF